VNFFHRAPGNGPCAVLAVGQDPLHIIHMRLEVRALLANGSEHIGDLRAAILFAINAPESACLASGADLRDFGRIESLMV
jgi:hypothetical protein